MRWLEVLRGRVWALRKVVDAEEPGRSASSMSLLM